MLIVLLRRYHLALVASLLCLFQAFDADGQDAQSVISKNQEIVAEEVIEDSKTGLLELGKELMFETGKRLNLVSDEAYAEKKKLPKQKMRFKILGFQIERK